MASFPKTKTTSKPLFDIISALKKLSVKTKVQTWKAVAAKLAGPASQRAEVNVSKIEKHSKSGSTIIVPGKVLGTGTISKKVTVVALSASTGAITKIEKAGGKFVSIAEYISKSPKDKPVILG